MVVYGYCHVNNGTLTISANSSVQVFGVMRVSGGSGSFGAGANTLLSFEDGSKLEWNRNSGSLYPANRTTWHSNSTLEIIGAVTLEPGNILNQSFGNVIWNSLGQTGNPNLSNNLRTVTGDYKFVSTGSGKVMFSGTGGATYNVAGNFEISGGTVEIGSGGTQILNVGGNFIQSGGSLDLLTGGAGTTSSTVNIAGDFSQTSGILTRTGGGSGTIVFNGSGNQSYTGGGTISGIINITVNNSAGLTLTTSVTFPATLSMTTGNISTGVNTLTLGTSTSNLGTLSYTSGTIVGNFRRWFAAGTVSNVLFPIGTSTNYRPASISFTSAPSVGGTLTAFLTSTDPGTAGLPIDDSGTSVINSGKEGYWTINSGDGLTGGTYSLDLTADGFSGVSVVSTLRIIKRATGGGDWGLDGSHLAGTDDFNSCSSQNRYVRFF